MRTLSAALQAAHAAPVQRPAWLVEVAFAPPLRLCSYGPVTAFGHLFAAGDVDVSRLLVDGAAVGGELSFGAADDVVAALVLGAGVVDRRIRVWGFDAAAVGDADFVLLADAVGGACRGNARRVTVALRAAQAFTASPRTTVGAAAGFTHLLPAGAVIRVGTQTITLERD